MNTLRVRLGYTESEAQVAVEDQGPGIPPHLRERIFDRCFTTDREGGPVPRGAGLGLAIARSLVEGMGGRIWVEDAREGGGADFRFTLPIWRGKG